MQRFSIDESGYTGFDLLNPQQPFQGATAISITEDEARRLVREHFPKLQAPELKYSAMARRPSNRERLVNLQRDLLAHHKCVTYVCDKRFLLILMFLNYSTEPWYYERGIDFYADGQNYAMASVLYYTGPPMLGADTFNAILAAFQRAVKDKTPAALKGLVLCVQGSRWKATLPEAFGPIALESPACLRAISVPGVSTDAAIVVLQSLISRMEVMADGPYRVEHDRSENLLQYNSFLQRLIAHDEPVEFRQSKIASIRFPLKLSEVTQVDSKESASVQVADVLIGAAIEAANALVGQRSPDIDPTKALSLYRDDQFIHLVPSIDFEKQKSFREGSKAAEVIEYFAKHFHR